MKTFTETLTGDFSALTEDAFEGVSSPEKVLVIDIETVGLSRERAMIYLIGCASFHEGVWELRQWLAESEADEKELLETFRAFAADYEAALTYNGARFDIPFLQARFTQHGLEDIFERMQSVDLYLHVRPVKALLGLQDARQVTLERFLNVSREDKYTGRELIGVYRDYAKEPTAEKEQTLLQHNADDVRGLLRCLPVLRYASFLRNLDAVRVVKAHSKSYEDVRGDQQKELYLELDLPTPLPAPISTHKDGCFLKTLDNTATLRVPIYEGELKYFYAGWRDYYYLPEEDTALHKSVAEYVEKAYRVKATPATCYTRKQGQYLQQWDTVFEPYFRVAYEEDALYFEITDERKKSREDLSQYAAHVIRHIVA